MPNKDYAYIQNNIVVNIAVFDEPDAELLQHFKNVYQLDEIILCDGNEDAGIGGTWDGIKFTLPQPYPSWVLVDNKWQAPISKPDDNKVYTWDEDTISWKEISLDSN